MAARDGAEDTAAADLEAAVGVEEVLAVEGEASAVSAAAPPEVAEREEVGRTVQRLKLRSALNFASAMCLVFADTDPNRAPIGMFIGLGIALAIVLVVLFVAIPISGEDFEYRGTDYYSGPFGSFGGYGGLGGFGL